MDPKRDMDERVSLEMDPDDALRVMLGLGNDAAMEDEPEDNG